MKTEAIKAAEWHWGRARDRYFATPEGYDAEYKKLCNFWYATWRTVGGRPWMEVLDGEAYK